jgi:hypothetical protein
MTRTWQAVLTVVGLALLPGTVQAGRCPFLMGASLNVQATMTSRPQQSSELPVFNLTPPSRPDRPTFPGLNSGRNSGDLGPAKDSPDLPGARFNPFIRTPYQFENRITTGFGDRGNPFTRRPLAPISGMRPLTAGPSSWDSLSGPAVPFEPRRYWFQDWAMRTGGIQPQGALTRPRSPWVYVNTAAYTGLRLVGAPGGTGPRLWTVNQMVARQPESPHRSHSTAFSHPEQHGPNGEPSRPPVHKGNPPGPSSQLLITASLTLSFTCGRCHGCPPSTPTRSPGWSPLQGRGPGWPLPGMQPANAALVLPLQPRATVPGFGGLAPALPTLSVPASIGAPGSQPELRATGPVATTRPVTAADFTGAPVLPALRGDSDAKPRVLENLVVEKRSQDRPAAQPEPDRSVSFDLLLGPPPLPAGAVIAQTSLEGDQVARAQLQAPSLVEKLGLPPALPPLSCVPGAAP